MDALTGTGTLTRIAIRRDRSRLVGWPVAVGLLVLAGGLSVERVYPTEADLAAAAGPVRDNPAVVAVKGPPQGIEHLGGRIAFDIGTVGLVVTGLLSLLLMVRLTRGEEESGRLEVVGAQPVGRLAPLASALAIVAGVDALTGVLAAAAMASLGLPAPGTVVFGLGFVLVGLVFAALAAAAAQVTTGARAASGLAGAGLGLAFATRAVGDVGDGSLSWASPIGWVQKARPYASERWWPLLVPVAATLGVAMWAVRSASGRDLGAGMLPARRGRPAASPLLRSPVGPSLRLQRSTIAAWAAGLFGLGLLYGSIADDVDSFLGDNPQLRRVLAATLDGRSLTDAYLATSLLILALLGSGFAVHSALRARSEEAAGRAALVLTGPVGRARWLAGQLAVTVAGSAVVLAAAGAGVGTSYGLARGDAGQVPRLATAALVHLPALAVLAAAAVAVHGITNRTAALAWVPLAYCLIVGILGNSLDLPRWVRRFSPFERLLSLPGSRLDAATVVAITGIAAALSGVGLLAHSRRDVA